MLRDSAADRPLLSPMRMCNLTLQMHMSGITIAIASAALSTPHARAQTPPVGDRHEIISSYTISEQTSDGSSGSSRGSDAVFERVISARDGGLELEYDLGPDATIEERNRAWQFPARVFSPSDGSMQLLNASELEGRLNAWLKAAELDRSVCGRWIFTWNAFRIECDPRSVIETIRAIDLRSQRVGNGVSYSDAGARAAGILSEKLIGANRAIYSTTLEIDPGIALRARAESDVATGEIMQKPISLKAAMGARAKEQISGTISIVIEADIAGRVWKRTKVTDMMIVRPDGVSENRNTTEILERRSASANGNR